MGGFGKFVLPKQQSEGCEAAPIKNLARLFLSDKQRLRSFGASSCERWLLCVDGQLKLERGTLCALLPGQHERMTVEVEIIPFRLSAYACCAFVLTTSV